MKKIKKNVTSVTTFQAPEIKDVQRQYGVDFAPCIGDNGLG